MILTSKSSKFLRSVLIFLRIVLLKLLGCQFLVREAIAGHLLSFIFELKLYLFRNQLETFFVDVHAGLHVIDSHSELLQVVLRVPIYIVLHIFAVLVHMSLLEGTALGVLDLVRSLHMHILKLLIPIIGRLVFPTDCVSEVYDIGLHLIAHLGYLA